ncbi:hypothetical protein J6590_049805 [Homalodisca vitripennis]|nr:hypothetical protein J6590_049805 [Homalodisca vitripennis]
MREEERRMRAEGSDMRGGYSTGQNVRGEKNANGRLRYERWILDWGNLQEERRMRAEDSDMRGGYSTGENRRREECERKAPI